MLLYACFNIHKLPPTICGKHPHVQSIPQPCTIAIATGGRAEVTDRERDRDLKRIPTKAPVYTPTAAGSMSEVVAQ